MSEGCGRLTMNMVLVGAEFAIARAETVLSDFCIPSLEIAGPAGHWVEVSRAIGTPNTEVRRMNDAYDEYFDAARGDTMTSARHVAGDLKRLAAAGDEQGADQPDHEALVRDLATLVKDYPGEAPVYVDLETSDGERTLALGPGYRVKPDSDFFAEAKALLGEAALV